MMIITTDRLSLVALAILSYQPTRSAAFSIGRLPRAASVLSQTPNLDARSSEQLSCSPIINLHPDQHNCKAAELVVNGTCQPIGFGDALDSCQEKCEPGQWCYDGACEPIQVVLNPYHCFGVDGPAELAPGEACVNGVAVPLNLTGDALKCGHGKEAKPCDPGNYCHDNTCTPITVGSGSYVFGADPYHCGPDHEECAPGTVCLSGTCQDLTVGEPLNTCNATELFPSAFCWQSAAWPLYLGTYAPACSNGGVPLAGSCLEDLPKTCQPSTQGADFGVVQILGESYSLGDPLSCGGRSCGGNSFCCSSTCVALPESQFGGCAGGCQPGECCINNECRGLSIGGLNSGSGNGPILGGSYSGGRCGETEICISGAVCLDIFPGSSDNCGSSGPCQSGSICISGTCVSSDDDDDDDELCFNGVCVDADPSSCDPACASDSRCVDGVCVLATGPDTCDPACTEGNTCINGQCVPPGEGCDPACTGGDICINGVCTPPTGPNTCDPACTGDDTCINGECIPPGEGCDPACTGGEVCQNGVCTPETDPAACDPACTGTDICVDGVCTPVVDPTACDPECAGGDVCVAGVCVTPDADCDPACTGTDICVDGTCIPAVDPTVCDPECTGTDICVDGLCVPAVDPDACDPECTGTDICVDGTCVPGIDPTACDPECTGTDVCVDGVCVPVDPTACDPECTGGDICEGGTCVPGPQFCDLECADGLVCLAVDVAGLAVDACVGADVCVPILNTGCPSGSTCVVALDNSLLTACVPNDSTPPEEVICGDTICTDGLVCLAVNIAGLAVDACVGADICVPILNTGCPSGSTCAVALDDSLLTACVPNDSTPPEGVVCGDTTCADGLICVSADVAGLEAGVCVESTPCTVGETGGVCGVGLLCAAGADSETGCVQNPIIEVDDCGGTCGDLACTTVALLGVSVANVCVDLSQTCSLLNPCPSSGGTLTVCASAAGLDVCVAASLFPQ